jgi:Restriction endonuclease AspBHI N-terminal/Restriction endonuclease
MRPACRVHDLWFTHMIITKLTTGNIYRVAHSYVDKGNPHLAGDEFSGWLAIVGRTIAMTGGIRPRSYIHKIGIRLPAYVVLVTANIVGDHANPWEDIIDRPSGVIRYWGDAKFSTREKGHDAFPGNRCLKRVYEEMLVGDRSILPPILHFSRPSTGRLVFNGLCALETMELTWFEDGGRPIMNYRYGLSILDEECVSLEWLRSRTVAADKKSLEVGAPIAWVDYVRGRTRRRQLWRAQILDTKAQLPKPGSDDERVLKQLMSLPPKDFEAVIVALLREMKTVEHSITGTRYVNDSGFDFFGSFTMPLPVGYKVPLRGEAKRWKQGIGVGEVSRLVARLRRGEYGIFVTTSYYTRQTQEEVLEDAYPVKLFSGADLVRFFRELKLIAGDHLRADWLAVALRR